MTTVSGTFVANGASSSLKVKNIEKDLIWSVTGPWDGRIALQEADFQGLRWSSIVELTDSRLSLVRTFKSRPNTQYRVALFDTVADVTNGAFASDTAWTKGTGWTIAGGKGVATGGISTAISQVVTGLVPGASYVVTFTTSNVSAGGVLASLGGGTAGTEITGNSSNSQTLVAGSSNLLLAFTGNAFTGEIDDVSITPSIAYSLADAVAVVEELRTKDNAVIRSVTDDGAHTITGNLTVTGTITGTGAGAGTDATYTGTVQGADLVATDDLTVGDDVTVTAGDITVSAGNIVATLGNVTAGATVQGADLVATDDLTVGDDAAITGSLTAGDFAGVPSAELQALDPSQKCTYFTDFLGDALEDELLAGVGSGTGNAVALVAGQGGRVEIKTASDDGAHSANASSISVGSLSYRADAGGLVLEARVQVDNITDVAFFVGFTDALASTVELPIFLNAADLDSDADNACGIIFDTDATTDQFCHGGVKATADTTPAFSGSAPVNATWVVLRVEVSVAGAVQGFINGTAIGAAVADAVTVTTPLCPIIVCANRGAAARNLLVDYLWVQQNR